MAELQTVSISNLPNAGTLDGAERIPADQEWGSEVNANALAVGTAYRIVSLGNTNWQACGFPASITPEVGKSFKATAVGSGSGTAIEVRTVDISLSSITTYITDQIPGTDLSYDQSEDRLYSSTGESTYLPLSTDELNGLQSAAHSALIEALIVAGVTAAGSTVTIPHIHADLAGSLYVHIKNTSGSQLTKGTFLRITGQVGDTPVLQVAAADPASAATMPAFGVLSETIANNDTGHAVVAGELLGLNTANLAPGTILYVAAGGGWTATRPTSGEIQQMAIVGRVHASTGSVAVTVGSLQSPLAGLAAVATSGAYSDLSGRPTLGTAAAADTGTAAGNVVALDGAGLIPSALLPGFVDDVLEYANIAAFPATGETGKLYVSLATNRVYRWSGSIYVEIAASPGTTDEVTEGSVNLYFTNARARAAISAAGSLSYNPATGVISYTAPAEIGLACSDESTALTTGTAKITFRMPYAMTLVSVRLSVTTAPTGSALIVDVNEGGTSIFSTNPRIDAGSTTSVGSGTPAVISDTALADNAVITVDIDQIGSTVAGTGLKVWLIGGRA